MSTFHPADSSPVNFNDTISTISMIRLLVYISCFHQDKNQRLSWHTAHTLWGFHSEQQVNTEKLHQTERTQCSGSSKISTFHPATSSLVNFNGNISTISTTRLFCHVHVLPKRCRGFGGVVNFSLRY